MRSCFAEAGAVSEEFCHNYLGRLDYEAEYTEHQTSPLWLCFSLISFSTELGRGTEASYTKIEDGVPVAACPRGSATRQLTARVCPAPIGPAAPYFVSAATRPHLEWHFLFASKFQTRPPGQDA